MVYLGLNAEYLPLTGASGNYLPGGPKNYSTQKVITYSDSTRKTVQENVFCLYGTILNLVTKVGQTLPISDQFLSSMQTGRCDPYEHLHNPAGAGVARGQSGLVPWPSPRPGFLRPSRTFLPGVMAPATGRSRPPGKDGPGQ